MKLTNIKAKMKAPKVAKAKVAKSPKVAKVAKAKVAKSPKVAKAPKVAKVAKAPKVAKVAKAPKVAKVAKAPKVAKVAKVAKKVTLMKLISGGGGCFSAPSHGLPKKQNQASCQSQTQAIHESKPPLPEIVIDNNVKNLMIKSLHNIHNLYITLFITKIRNDNFTLNDLILLINNITTNLNIFFEYFINYYPYIKFEKSKYYDWYDDINVDITNYQRDFIYLIRDIHGYIDYIGKNKNSESQSLKLYGIISQGDAKTKYYNSGLHFFKSDLNYPQDILREFKNIYIKFNESVDDILYPYSIEYPYSIKFNDIINRIHYILKNFFGHISSSLIIGYEPEETNKKVYIESLKTDIKNIANQYFNLLVNDDKQIIIPGIEKKVSTMHDKGVFNPLSPGWQDSKTRRYVDFRNKPFTQ